MKGSHPKVQSKRRKAANPAEMLRSASDSFRLSPGEVLFREGDAGDRMYVLLEGRMDILIGDTCV